MKGLTAGIKDQPSDIASVKYRAYLTAGVERWREYRDLLAPLGKKPIFFVMLNSTAEADDVGDYLRVTYPEDFGAPTGGKAQLLVIHTDRSGEVSKKDLDAARDVARRVDESESPVTHDRDDNGVKLLAGIGSSVATAHDQPPTRPTMTVGDTV